jgi:hypothetical protein
MRYFDFVFDKKKKARYAKQFAFKKHVLGMEFKVSFPILTFDKKYVRE